MIIFIKPLYLSLLALVPLVILIHFYTLKRKRVGALKFANFDAIARIKGIDLLSRNISVLFLTVLIMTLIVFSLAGLVYQTELRSSSSSFIIALDSSRSMEATDILPTRIEAAKESALSFVDSMPVGSEIGVISFSGNAFIEQDVTDDKALVKQAIRKIPVSSIGGTDLFEAVLTSTNLLEGEEAKSVILISDGRINVGTVDDVIDYANENDVIVHTLGVGTDEGGLTSYGVSKIDEDVLKSVAFNTGGKFFRVQDRVSLENAFSEIIELKLRKVSIDLSGYLILVVLGLFFIEYILINTRYKVLP